MRRKLEYAAAWPFIKILGILPRSLSRALAIGLAQMVYLLHFRLRQVGMRNLEMVFPEKSVAERQRILRGVFTSLGRQLAELCQFPRYTPENIDQVVVYDGLENYERAYARGKGVLFLTGHFGGWELSAFAHSLHGHWLHVVMRPMDNPYLDRLLQRYRTMYGNKTVGEGRFRARSVGGNEGGRDGRNPNGYEHDAAAGNLCGLFWHSRLHGKWTGAHCFTHGCCRAARVYDLGRGAPEISAAF